MANKAKGLLDKFVDSVGELLNDINALEVNTMVVSEITGVKFSAWEAYQAIYSINDSDYFEGKNISAELQERYLNLFEKLERELFYILIESDLKIENKHESDPRIKRYRNRIKSKTELGRNPVDAAPNQVNKLAAPILPDPTNIDEWKEIQKWLKNSQFLRSLRKSIELKAVLDSKAMLDSSEFSKGESDIIYAQTVMQLDGDIITRYHEKLFEDNDIKDLILRTHNEGVVSGERQWRGLLEFMVNLVKSATSRRFF